MSIRRQKNREQVQKAGAFLKTSRKAANLTQREMAKELDIDYFTFISQTENGFARVPPARLSEWATVLKIPVYDLAANLLRYYQPEYYRALFNSKKT